MMNEKTLETIIEKTIREAGAVASFTWQGGEPTLRGIDFFEKAVALQKKYKQQYQRNNLHIMNSFHTVSISASPTATAMERWRIMWWQKLLMFMSCPNISLTRQGR